ncbi:hypothetical protein C8R45DRAFT_928632 [Mycena sanguinolenta]|nr:hypothetical protein C8R45DRAFT_928632 [Mycena sanguinolenta]
MHWGMVGGPKVGLVARPIMETCLLLRRQNMLQIQPRYNGHCAHAQLDRWQEEVKIIAQFSRAIQGFEKMKTVWTALADNHKNDPKRQTHALKTSNMYQQMENKGREKFREVGGTWPQNRVSLSQYIQCERLDRKITGEAIIFAED